jgi:dihydrofolate synthase/folylpolyglutamate synthase
VSSRIDGIVARLHALHPRLIDLSLGRLEELLAKLGHPERRLPPVIHVAGTNGKGSTCAFLRAIAEAAGLRVHVYTSPHLVRFNERIRIAGELVSDADLADAMEHVEAVNAGAPITVFEVITAVAFYLFAAIPADLCVLEVGLGGRFDATNVITPVACAITSISMDHQDFLGDTLEQIAFEKAGIMKPGVPVATGAQAPAAAAVLRARAAELGAPLSERGRDWFAEPVSTGIRYRAAGVTLDLPPPGLAGPHQIDNAGIAITAIRAAVADISESAIARGLRTVEWAARLQRLTGRLAGLIPQAWELWLDGGHNPGAGVVLGTFLDAWRDRPIHVIVGMKQAKDSAEFLRPLIPHAATLWAVSEPGQHLAKTVDAIVAASGGVARPGPTIAEALDQIDKSGPPARVLICGSLYLAGEVLKANAV